MNRVQIEGRVVWNRVMQAVVAGSVGCFLSPNFLRHNGWTSTTVNAGDTITCTGAPAKSGSKFMHGVTIQLSSGVQLRS